jgi:uncharacterized membrane protein YdbT with pleckstrin-like domain
MSKSGGHKDGGAVDHSAAAAAADRAEAAAASGAVDPTAVAANAAAAAAARRAAEADPEKRMLYEGRPSWKAYFFRYVLAFLMTPAAGYGAYWLTRHWGFLAEKSFLVRTLVVVGPLLIGLIYIASLYIRRRLVLIKVSTRSIEMDSGLLSRKIEVLELWRVRDIRYKQSIFDRMLGIAHIEMFTHDVTTPHFEIVGMPASQKLFEDIRDHIELSRQSRRVMGVID